MMNRVRFHRKVEAPSIPSQGQAYGYEEREDGTLRKQDPPERDDSLGPAFYKAGMVSTSIGNRRFMLTVVLVIKQVCCSSELIFHADCVHLWLWCWTAMLDIWVRFPGVSRICQRYTSSQLHPSSVCGIKALKRDPDYKNGWKIVKCGCNTKPLI